LRGALRLMATMLDKVGGGKVRARQPEAAAKKKPLENDYRNIVAR
jgi:hypothetical protein